jgi:hypothetical protein
MPHRSTDRIAGSEDEKYNLRMGLDHLMWPSITINSQRSNFVSAALGEERPRQHEEVVLEGHGGVRTAEEVPWRIHWSNYVEILGPLHRECSFPAWKMFVRRSPGCSFKAQRSGVCSSMNIILNILIHFQPEGSNQCGQILTILTIHHHHHHRRQPRINPGSLSRHSRHTMFARPGVWGWTILLGVVIAETTERWNMVSFCVTRLNCLTPAL